ncbi:ATP-grasp fold amidoligase family protein [Shimia abyssi]|uniref:Teichuronopeptide biosynthesis TupA-like protein n=1 Tax=Shimia abyssi TaxID=1662395 RepID=A0A2P8FBN0_9RHOB|nr:ATP-grasp fold amidoligase family protein [Shimia abyssi]PSL19119.1 teichuronopeptide biosynthesis TupA-like protein [Shimia abyssi]
MTVQRYHNRQTRRQAKESIETIYGENLFGAADPAPVGFLRGIDVYPHHVVVQKLTRAIQMAHGQRGRKLDFVQPRTYYEKLVLSKFFAPLPMPSPADKIGCSAHIPVDVRDKVKTIPTVWTGAEPITKVLLDSLDLPPGRYYAKSNNGCTTNYAFDVPISPEQMQLLERYSTGWLKRLHGERSGEWYYSKIRAQNLIEPDMSPAVGEDLTDWKFHCCRGKVFAGQIDVERSTNHHQLIYDRDFNYVPEELFFFTKPGVEWPEHRMKMREVAEAISRPFEYARIDLYLVGDQVYLGEITMAPIGGQRLPRSETLDHWMGERWQGGIFDEIIPDPIRVRA